MSASESNAQQKINEEKIEFEGIREKKKTTKRNKQSEDEIYENVELKMKSIWVKRLLIPSNEICSEM